MEVTITIKSGECTIDQVEAVLGSVHESLMAPPGVLTYREWLEALASKPTEYVAQEKATAPCEPEPAPPAPEPVPESEPEPAPEPPAPEPAPEPPAPEPEPAPTPAAAADLRGSCADLVFAITNGRGTEGTAIVRNLLREFGSPRLGAVPVERLAEFKRRLEML